MNRRSETTTKVFVGSLPTGVTTDDLRTLFAPYGEIAECDISNRCGFLHLEDNELAMKAVAELNGTNFMGGRISVEKGRVKPRRGPGVGGGGPGPMRGGKDRGGPYARTDFRGPPHRNGGGFGGREFPPYGSPGGVDRFGGYDRAQRGGYDGGYGDRRPPPYDDRRVGAAGGFGAERRPYTDDGYGRPYEDDRAGGYAEAPRAEYDDRRSAGPPQRGPSGYDRGAPPVSAELYSRRDQGPKSMYDAPASSDYRSGAGGYTDRAGYATSSSNGYGSGGYSTSAASAGGYGSPAPAPSSAYGTSSAGFGSSAPSAGGYGDTRGYGTATGGGGGYGNPGGYGDSYGATGGARGGSYDAAYPPLPQQRGGFTSGGGPGGPRRDMAAGRRF